MDESTFGFEEQFQRGIAAALLKDPTFLIHYEDILLPSYFDFDYISTIVRIARELTERIGQVPTKMTMVEEVKEFCVRFNLSAEERDNILNKLEEVYVIEDYDLSYIQDKVVGFGQRQAFRVAVLKAVTLLSNSKQKFKEDVYDKAWDLIDKSRYAGSGIRDMGIQLYPSLEMIPDLAAKSPSGLGRKIPTLFKKLDEATMGGPGRGEVWSVMGLPGRGKSAFLMNIGAAAVKQGEPVIHITIGDLNEIDVSVRYAACLTNSTVYEVITKSDAYMSKAAKLSRYSPYLRVKYFPADTVTAQQLRAFVARVRTIDEISPALIIVDYPEELKHTGDNSYKELGGDYTTFNKMAAEFEALLWTASQPQRWKPEHAKDVIRGINIGESFKVFKKLDGFVTWNMSHEEELLNRARLWVDKTRRARSYYLVHMDTDLERMRIQEGTPPEDVE